MNARAIGRNTWLWNRRTLHRLIWHPWRTRSYRRDRAAFAPSWESIELASSCSPSSMRQFSGRSVGGRRSAHCSAARAILADSDVEGLRRGAIQPHCRDRARGRSQLDSSEKQPAHVDEHPLGKAAAKVAPGFGAGLDVRDDVARHGGAVAVSFGDAVDPDEVQPVRPAGDQT